MKNIFFTRIVISLMFVVVLLSGSAAIDLQAQTSRSLSGDEVCGSSQTTKCTLNDAKQIITSALGYILALGTILLGVFLVARIAMAWFAVVVKGESPAAIKVALSNMANAIFGFLIIAAIIGGLYVAMLNFLGVKADFLNIFASAFVDTAYAQQGNMVTNPLAADNLYDFVLLVVRLFIRWFIYPAIIALWVWTGFSFVAAQGRPEQLKKAKSWLLWSVGCTIMIFMTESFLFALRGTVNEILPNSNITTQPANLNRTSDGRTAPAAGTAGAVCTINGTTGQVGTDGICYPSRGGAGSVTGTAGAACTINGVNGRFDTTGACVSGGVR